MKVNVADYDRYVVRKHGYYLVALKRGVWPIWSPYKYDAARMADSDKARLAARKTGGIVMRFNHVTGEVF